MINNLITVLYMLGLVAIVVMVNTLLGVVIANKEFKFDKAKLFKGIFKAIIVIICLFLFCITLELVPTVLARVGVDVPSEIITVLEIVLTGFTAYKKYATDCFDKFKKILKIEEEEENE